MPSLRRNGVPVTLDPLGQSAADRRTVLAMKVQEQTISQVESDNLEAENKLLAARIEGEKLREQLRASSGAGGGPQAQWVEWITEELRSTRAALADAKTEADSIRQTQMEDRLATLKGEIERLQQVAQSTPDADPMARTRETISQARELVNMITPQPPDDETPRGVDPALLAYNRRMSVEELRVKIEAQREERMQNMQWEREREERQYDRQQKDKELDLKEKEMQMRTRFFSETGPQIVEYLVKIVGIFTQGPNGAVPPMNPAAAAQAYGQAVASGSQPPALPPGVHLDACKACGAPIVYSDKWDTVQCAGCGEVYNLTDDGEEAKADAAPMGAQEAASDGNLSEEESEHEGTPEQPSDGQTKRRVVH